MFLFLVLGWRGREKALAEAQRTQRGRGRERGLDRMIGKVVAEAQRGEGISNSQQGISKGQGERERKRRGDGMGDINRELC